MRLVLCLSLGAALLRGQFPAHAVQLNTVSSFLPPLIASSGDAVVAIGTCYHPNLALCFARSPDGGRTWPIRDALLGPQYRCEALRTDSGRFFALAADSGLHVLRSLDAGVTWSSAMLDAGPVGSGVGLAIEGSTVIAAWKNGNGLQIGRSFDGGSTWLPPQRIDPNIAPNYGPWAIAVVLHGPQLNVSWDYYTGPSAPQVAHQRSLDGGTTWLPAALTLQPALLAGAVGGGAVQLVAGVGSPLLRSTDAGATWSPVTAHGIPQMEALAADGSIVLAVGTIGQLPNLSYALSVSADGGNTWLPGPYVLPTFATWRTSAWVIGTALFVLWRPGWASNTGVLIQSDDLGFHWRTVTSVRSLYNENAWPSAERCLVTAITPSQNTSLAWVLVGHTVRGSGTTGLGGLEPSLGAAGLPSLGHTFDLEVRQARGATPGLLAFSAAGPGYQPLGTATLWIQMPVFALPFATAGSPNTPGTGTFTQPVSIPASTAFAGTNFATQAFVLDGAAVDGFAATRAIETWVH